MEDYSSIEGLEQAFSKKTSVIREGLAFRHMDEDTACRIPTLEAKLFQVRNIFEEIRKLTKDGDEKLEEMKKLLKFVEDTNTKLEHMEKNFPPPLKEQNASKMKENIPCNTGSKTPCGPKESRMPPKISHLTEKEFENIPKYMKGGISCNHINNFIDSFNKTMETKYKLLSIPRKKMKPEEYKICSEMKLQENGSTKGIFFCTSDNMKIYGNIKISKATTNYLTILRHCSRMKEIRGPGSLVRYAVIA